MRKAVIKIDEKKLNLIFLLLYAGLYILITVFHEPWLDEAQAWQIAKCASLKDIILRIPHYEGHPPLWWLILALPAKSGFPYEISIKIIGFIFSNITVGLLIFKGHFPKYIRYTLPFSYYFFYQYGIIVRPYCMMMLAFILIALCFKDRHEHPFRFIACLVFLCLTSAYGMLFACGIALCYLYEILKDKGLKQFVKDLFIDRRILALIILLLVAIVLALDILPRHDTYAMTHERLNSIPVLLLVTLFTIIPDCLFTRNTWFLLDDTMLSFASIGIDELISAVIIGICVWAIIYMVSSRKSFCYFVVPYTIFATFSAFVYFTAHHEGAALLLMTFWLWITLEDDERFYGWNVVSTHFACLSRHKLGIKKIAYLFILLCIGVNFYWTGRSVVADIRFNYCHGRDMAAFIHKHGLDNLKVAGDWYVPTTIDGEKENTNHFGAVIQVLPYFNHNFIMNLNGGNDDEAYLNHIAPTDRLNNEHFEEWKKKGIPDAYIGYVDIKKMTGGKANEVKDYSLVYYVTSGCIWKGLTQQGNVGLCVRKDLLKKYGLHEVKMKKVSRKIK